MPDLKRIAESLFPLSKECFSDLPEKDQFQGFFDVVNARSFDPINDWRATGLLLEALRENGYSIDIDGDELVLDSLEHMRFEARVIFITGTLKEAIISAYEATLE